MGRRFGKTMSEKKALALFKEDRAIGGESNFREFKAALEQQQGPKVVKRADTRASQPATRKTVKAKGGSRGGGGGDQPRDEQGRWADA